MATAKKTPTTLKPANQMTKADADALIKSLEAKGGTKATAPTTAAPVAGAPVIPTLDFSAEVNGPTPDGEDPIDALLQTVGLYGIRSEMVDITGVGANPIGPAVTQRTNRKILTTRQAVTHLDYLSAAELTKLQKTLYEAGFYPNDYYKPGAEAPKGDRYTDRDFLGAYAEAIKSSFLARGTEKFSDVLAKNIESYRPVFIDKAKGEADLAAKKIEAAKNDAERETARREKEAADIAAANLAARTPTKVTTTQSFELPSMASLAGDINAKAQALLGRDATDDERKVIGELLRDQLKARGLQSADVAQFNQNRNDPIPGTGVDPLMGGAPGDGAGGNGQYNPRDIRTDGSADARVDGLDPGFGSALTAFQRDARAAGFDIVVGSGHRTEAEQAALFAKSDKTGHTVASAKGSKHVSGEATDLRFMVNGKAVSLGSAGTQKATEWAHANAAKYGLTFPMSYEKWHVEPVTARNKKAVMPALPGVAAAVSVGQAGAGAAVDIGAIVERLAQVESGGQNIPTKAKGSSASGYYQITDPTWGKYKGYARAIDAPREVQREKAMSILSRNLQKFGTPDLALAAYFAGANNSKAKLQSLMSEDRSPTAGTKTANMGVGSYVRKILGTTTPGPGGVVRGYEALPGSPTPSLVSGGTSRSAADASGVRPYAGAVTTANGANVLVQDQIDPAQTIQDELLRRAPMDAQVYAATGFYDVYRRLAGGR